MPVYEYEYVKEGRRTRVQRVFRMSERPDTITVEDGGQEFEAKNVISLTAKMANNWAVKGTTSDLPSENSPVLNTGDVVPEP